MLVEAGICGINAKRKYFFKYTFEFHIDDLAHKDCSNRCNFKVYYKMKIMNLNNSIHTNFDYRNQNFSKYKIKNILYFLFLNFLEIKIIDVFRTFTLCYRA